MNNEKITVGGDCWGNKKPKNIHLWIMQRSVLERRLMIRGLLL